MKIKRIFAATISALMLTSAVPMTAINVGADESTTVIYATDFEDGSVGSFKPRMNEGQSVALDVVTDSATAHGGDSYLKCSGREKAWQGISLPVDDITETGKEYVVEAALKAQWYSDMALSIQYDDTSGTTKYVNITKVTSQGEWQEIADAKALFPVGSTNRSLYFECSSEAKAEIYLDDFSLTTAPVYEIEQDIAALKDVYANYFKFGTAATDTELANESAQNLIKKHFNSITPGNELKPESLLDQAACQAQGNNVNPIINIAPARNILNFARDNNIPVRGHVLVWHSQTPGWFFKENFDSNGEFVSEEIMLQRMENYIKNVMEALATEYPTVDFYAWDVVNEAWLDDGSCRKPGTYDENSNLSGWVQVFGDNSFIEPAFEYARKYAPEGCKLYYNDFNEYMPGKTTAIVNMANELKEKNLIDGIGMQSHLDVRSGSDAFPGISAYEKAMKAFSETGLDIQVTELDATVNGNTEELFEAQAQYYSDILDVCVKYSDNISAVVLWGTTDDKSWRNTKYPLIFNEDFTAKPSYYSIIDGIEYEVPTTEATEPTTEPVTDPTEELTTTEPITDPTEEVTTTVPVTEPLVSITDTTTTTTIYAEPYGNIVIESVPTKIDYEVGEELDLSGLTVSLDFFQGILGSPAKRIYDNVNPLDYPDVFVVDTSEFDNTTEGSYNIIIKLTNEARGQWWCYHNYDFEVTVTNGSTEPPTSGDEITVPEDVEASMYGDVNLDGSVDVADVVALNTLILGGYEATPEQLANADCAKDGVVNSTDSTILMNFVAMIIDSSKLGV